MVRMTIVIIVIFAAKITIILKLTKNMTRKFVGFNGKVTI